MDHHKLDVYRVAREFNRFVHDLVAQMPSGRSDLINQVQRAAASIPLNIAEGAGEFAPKEKSRFYRIAKRSATECSAVLDTLVDVRHTYEKDTEPGQVLLDRIAGMLVKMIKSCDPRGTNAITTDP